MNSNFYQHISRNNSCYIIAEAGTSHNGNIKEAQKLIDTAQQAGADCVKFQIVYADEIIHQNTGLVDLPGGKVSLYQVFKNLEQQPEFFAECKNYAESKGVDFLASVFGKKSLSEYLSLKPDAVKIASPELNHIPLLKDISSANLPVIVSTGVSKLKDIDEAVALLPEETVLLHCITSYPAPEEEYNLRLIASLGSIFGLPVGISDHSKDPLLVPAVSTLLGSCILEKHITLSHAGAGLDDPIALQPEDFRRMTEAVRKIQSMPYNDAIDYITQFYERKRIENVLGDGVKRLAKSEAENYGLTNRSIHAKKEIHQGEVLSEENIAILRTEKQLLPGLHPRYYSRILGSHAKTFISSGQGIQWKDIIS
ncbi:MAG: N-acetylneuraminate synthase family protein [Spirochaetia bacterium]